MLWFGLRTELQLLRHEVDRLRDQVRGYESTELQRTASALNAAAQLRTAAARVERANARAAAPKHSPIVDDDDQEELIEAGSFREAVEHALSFDDEDDDGEADR